MRLCVDFRALNKLTLLNNYPLPRIDEVLDKVASAKYISTLDLTKGYYQVPLAPDAIPKTSFTTPSGKYEFLAMPFSLKNTPAAFQRLIDHILNGLHYSLIH